jgi:outer membrane protein
MAMTLEQAQARALSARPELRSAHERIESAENLRIAAKEHYLPDIRAVAAWQHFTGVQPFEPEDEEYVGLTAQWNVWDWGATHDAVLEAERAKTKATLQSNALVDHVKLDVRTKWLAAKTQFDSLAVAEQQQTTAEEAYRLQKVKLDNAAATTTDVLDAQTDVVRARVAFATARFDYYLALVALARSVGDLPHP